MGKEGAGAQLRAIAKATGPVEEAASWAPLTAETPARRHPAKRPALEAASRRSGGVPGPDPGPALRRQGRGEARARRACALG
eukprot:3747012-Pyramimonas_sp.AAC.1